METEVVIASIITDSLLSHSINMEVKMMPSYSLKWTRSEEKHKQESNSVVKK